MIRMDVVTDAPDPKRGDLVQTNVGDRRERTMIVLQSRHIKSREHPRRFELQAARWWEIEPETRQALARSAERRGGQQVFLFRRYKAKRKMTFEQLMRGEKRERLW